jgi:hypothetical protein
MLRRIGRQLDRWSGRVALFLVLASGTAYAANTIYSGDIVDGQVKTVDLANVAVTNGKLAGNAVTSNRVLDGSLSGHDVLDNSLRGADIDESSLSLAGSGASKVVVRSAYIPSDHGTVPCHSGEVATGGGVSTDVPNLAYVGRSEPDPTSGVPTGWTGSIKYRADGSAASGTVFVLCASP